MELSGRGNFYRRLLGLQSPRLGRLLGLGSRRKFFAGAVAVGGRPVALNQPCPQETRRVVGDARGGDVHLCACTLRDVFNAVGRVGRFLGTLVRGLEYRLGNRPCQRVGVNRRARDNFRQSKVTATRQNVRHARRIGVRGLARLSVADIRRGNRLDWNVNAAVESTGRRGGGGRFGLLRQEHRAHCGGVVNRHDLRVREIRAGVERRREGRACRLPYDVGGDCRVRAGRNRNAGTSAAHETFNRGSRGRLRRTSLLRIGTAKILRVHGRRRSRQSFDETARQRRRRGSRTGDTEKFFGRRLHSTARAANRNDSRIADDARSLRNGRRIGLHIRGRGD